MLSLLYLVDLVKENQTRAEEDGVKSRKGRFVWKISGLSCAVPTSLRPVCSRPGSILISQVSTVCISSLSRGVEVPVLPHPDPPSPSHHPSLPTSCLSFTSSHNNTQPVTFHWLLLPNLLNVGKAWNDEEFLFLHTGDALLWPTVW